MFTIAFSFIPLIMAGIWYLAHLNAQKYDRPSMDCARYEGGLLAFCYVLLFVSFVPATLSVVATMGSYGSQVYDSEKIIQLRGTETVYEKRALELTKQFQTYLADAYPSHEREIFERISPENIDVYLAKFPEIRASETIIELVKQVRSMKDDMYAQQIEREKVLKEMRFRTRNPWIFYSFIPAVPAV